MNELQQDLRFAFRSLLRHRGFGAAAIATLALGIGANTALFSLVEGVLLRPLPFPASGRIVRILESRADLMGESRASGFSIDHFRDWRESNRSFQQMAAYQDQTFTLSGVDEPVELHGMRVSPELNELLGVPALLGAGLRRENEEPGKNYVVTLSHSLWTSRFGADPEIVGKSVTFDGDGYTVVGVMPSGFQFPEKGIDFWVPLTIGPRPAFDPHRREVRLVPVVARLRDEVSIEAAEAEGNALIKKLYEDQGGLDPEERQVRIHLESLLDQTVGPYQTALWTLMAAVGAVLLIACANVANLLLARATDRRREIAVRAAMGAGRVRLLRQALTESLLLSFLGGGFGVLVALVAIRLFRAVAPTDFPRLDEVGVDPIALGFTVVACVFTGLLFGSAPSLQAWRIDLVEVLKGHRTSADAGVRGNRFRWCLVVTEIALALALLTTAGLLGSSFFRLVNVDPGYSPSNVLVIEMNLPPYRYAGMRGRVEFFDRLRERLSAIPGIQFAGIANLLPLTRSNIVINFQVLGRPLPTSEEEIPRANFRIVSPGYFQAMGIPLKSGRVFSDSDSQSGPAALVINQMLADRYFPEDNPLGARTNMGEVIGVVGNVKNESLEAEVVPEFYISYQQAPPFMSRELSGASLVIRSSNKPERLAEAVRAQISDLDAELPAFQYETMADRVSDSVAQPRLYALLLAIFSGLALGMAMIGVYSVISYSVAQTTYETGVRIALGAKSSDILAGVLRRGLSMILAGVALGLAGSLLVSRLLSSLLFGITATDPTTFVTSSLATILVAFVACWFPARRAARLDPSAALRYD